MIHQGPFRVHKGINIVRKLEKESEKLGGNFDYLKECDSIICDELIAEIAQP